VLCNRTYALSVSSIQLHKPVHVQSLGIPETRRKFINLLTEEGFDPGVLIQERNITELSRTESIRLACVFPKDVNKKNVEMYNVYCLPSILSTPEF
jgi:hypothetical protein